MSKPWLGIDAQVHEAIKNLEDYAAIGQYYGGFSQSSLANNINIVLAAYRTQLELNERLNAENKSLIKYGVVTCANLKEEL